MVLSYLYDHVSTSIHIDHICDSPWVRSTRWMGCGLRLFVSSALNCHLWMYNHPGLDRMIMEFSNIFTMKWDDFLKIIIFYLLQDDYRFWGDHIVHIWPRATAVPFWVLFLQVRRQLRFLWAKYPCLLPWSDWITCCRGNNARLYPFHELSQRLCTYETGPETKATKIPLWIPTSSPCSPSQLEVAVFKLGTPKFDAVWSFSFNFFLTISSHFQVAVFRHIPTLTLLDYTWKLDIIWYNM